jgi:anti-sigma B factor antagonist
MLWAERSDGIVTILDITGRLNLGDGTEEFRALLVGLIGERKTRIVLNMAGCRHVDSAGLGELATALVRTQNAGGKLVLLNLPDRVRELLRITRLLEAFTVQNDEAAAVAAAQMTLVS